MGNRHNAWGNPVTSPRRTSIRTQLFALAFGVAAPVIGLLGYLLYLDAGNAVDRAGDAALRLAQTTAAETGKYFNQNRAFMERMAKRPMIRAMDPARCDPLINDLQPLTVALVAIYVANLKGELICSNQPIPAGVTIADREWFRRATR